MKNFLLGISMLFLMAGCSTLKIDVDYDTFYDFDNKTDYSVVHSDREGTNSLIADRITKAIKKSLNAKAYSEVAKKDAQLIFVFHTNVKNKTDIEMDYQTIGFGGFGMGFGSNVIATPTTYNYTEGTLIIDALNPKTKKIVWRSVGSDELGSHSTPQEKTEYINKVVAQMMAKFPPKEGK